MVDGGTEEEEDKAFMPCNRNNNDIEDSDKDNDYNESKGRKRTKNDSRVKKVKDYKVLDDANMGLIAEAKGGISDRKRARMR